MQIQYFVKINLFVLDNKESTNSNFGNERTTRSKVAADFLFELANSDCQ